VTRRPNGDDRGSVAVELVIIAPIFGLLLLAVVAVGRVQDARADVEAAARMAARDLSIARDPHARETEIAATVATMLHVGSPSCRTMSLDTTIGVATVDVTVSCHAELQQAALLPVPGSMTVSATVSEPRDVHREESP